MPDFQLSGKRALVTGGSHGIGLSIARKLAEEGVSVALLSRNGEVLKKESEALASRGVESLYLTCDVQSEADVENAWKKLSEIWGGVDILINNVGGGGRWGSEDFLETSLQVWGEVFRKNAGVSTQLTKLALPKMIENNWGRVIAITSIYGEYIGGRPWFNVAKVAQATLMKNLAGNKKYARSGITFNAIAPGSILIPDTGWAMLEESDPEAYWKYAEELPLGRLGKPEEIANLTLFVCSPLASYINGASLIIDGGESTVL